MTDLTKLTLSDALDGMAKGDFSSEELTKAHIDACKFAMGSSNETSACGPVINPWKNGEDLVPGGSSGGSASAVAADMCLGATATDTGGSIRQPASFTGTVGIKPTYGRCSRWGTVAFASSLDQAGPIAKTVKDSAILLESMAGYDPKDSTSINAEVPNWAASCGQSVKGLRIGIPKEYTIDGMPAEIQTLWDDGIAMMKAAGAEIVPISLPHTKYALPAYYVVAPAEASSNLARYDGMRYGLRVDGKDLNDTYERTRTEGFGDEVRRRIMIGTYVLSAGYYDAYYLRAQKVRTRIVEDFENAWQRMACRWACKSSAGRWTRRQCSRRRARWRMRPALRRSLRSGGFNGAPAAHIFSPHPAMRFALQASLYRRGRERISSPWGEVAARSAGG